MGKSQIFWERLANEAELTESAIPGQSIIEIAGEHRVLIENHCGVSQYSRETIGIKVKFGLIRVCGCGLELIRMTRDQLVIAGRIDSVNLVRRG